MNFERSRRPLAILLLAVVVAALGTAAVAAIGARGDGSLVLLLALREHVVLLGWIALVALTGAIWLGLWKSPLLVPVITTTVAVGVFALLLGGFVSMLFGVSLKEVETASAPGRDDRRLVVLLGNNLDSIWCVRLRQGNPPMERQWDVGCFNDDDLDNGLRETVWTAPDRIRMTTRGGKVHEVSIAPDGRPDRFVRVG
ncbi:hypothetical protein [Streptomyces laurentii]|uniref:hypothetical protein n=1 Tax=Streptomyces laurentii TaxID=39478 RepID=UPI0036894520